MEFLDTWYRALDGTTSHIMRHLPETWTYVSPDSKVQYCWRNINLYQDEFFGTTYLTGDLILIMVGQRTYRFHHNLPSERAIRKFLYQCTYDFERMLEHTFDGLGYGPVWAR